MHGDWAHQLEAWREFYLLIGTAGATLTAWLPLRPVGDRTSNQLSTVTVGGVNL